MAKTIIEYREPTFTHDDVKKAWGEAYWGLSGQMMLDWIMSIQAKIRGLGAQAHYDHRPGINPVALRNVCWCIKPIVGEIPEDITDTYIFDIKDFPSGLPAEKKEEYILQKSWAHLYFKWDTMSVEPQVFNLLLAKLLAASDYNKVGLVILDTKDLYVNYNPVKWCKKYSAEYPVSDLDKQKELYEQWLTWSGFRRYYVSDDKGKFIATPWYFRAPVEGIPFGKDIKEYPPYKLHPLKVSGGTFYPPGYITP